jgi:hypothetical protein
VNVVVSAPSKLRQSKLGEVCAAAEQTLLVCTVRVDDEAFVAHTASEPFKDFFAIVGSMLEAGNLSIHQKTSKTPMVNGFGPRSAAG